MLKIIQKCSLAIIMIFLLLFISCSIPATHPSLKESSMVEIIPVRKFVANRKGRGGYKVSPDGKKLAWVEVKGTKPTVFYKKIGGNDIKSLDTYIMNFFWLSDSHRILYFHHNGDENTHFFIKDLDKPDLPVFNLTPYPGTKVGLVSMLYDSPENILIKHNKRDKSIFDLYRININTGKETLLEKNPGNIAGWFIDPSVPDGKITGHYIKTKSGYEIKSSFNSNEKFNLSYKLNFEDIWSYISFEPELNRLWLLSNRGRDKTALVYLNLKTMKETVVKENPEVDISSVFVDPVSKLHGKRIRKEKI